MYIYIYIYLYDSFIFLNKGLIQKVRPSWRRQGGGGGGGVNKKWTKANSGRGGWGRGWSLTARSLCKKIAWYLKQQIEFFLISCLAVAKSFSVLSLVHHIKVFFLLKRRRYFFSFNVFYEHVNVFIVIKHISL